MQIVGYEGTIVAANFLKGIIKSELSRHPDSVFYDSTLASVGVMENEARDQGLKFLVQKQSDDFELVSISEGWGKVVEFQDPGRTGH